MNICIPIDKDEGLLSQMSLHFSTARQYMIIDTKTMGYRLVDNADPDAAGASGADLLREADIDSIVVGGIGVRSLSELQAAGIDVVSTGEDTVENIVASYQDGDVNRVTLEHTCRFKHSGRGFRGPGGCGGPGDCR